jgi:hypothetical protein
MPSPATKTCLTSPDSPAPSDNVLSGEQTLVQQSVTEDLLCATYFARCMSGGTCTEAEVEAGKWKWVYGSLTDFECKELQDDDMSGEFKYVTCCSGSNCNVPDVELDTESHVAAEVKLERAHVEQQQQQQQQQASTVTAGASSDAAVGSSPTAAPISTAAAGSTADASASASSSNTTARTLVKSTDPESFHLTHTGTDTRNFTALAQIAPADGKYNATMVPATPKPSTISQPAAAPQQPKDKTNSDARTPTTSKPTPPREPAAAKPGDRPPQSKVPAKPNQQQQQQQPQRPGDSRGAADNKQQKPAQQPQTPQQKQRLQQQQKQKQLQQQKQQQLQKQRQQQIQQQRQRQAQQIQKQRQQQKQQQRFKPKHMAHGSGVPTLTCLRTVPRTRDLPPAVAPKLYRKSDGADMCARYKFRCANGDKTCTAAEIRAREWKWAYMPLSSSACMELKDFAGHRNAAIKNVLCCSKTNCNRPSPALDPHTKVRLAAKVTVITVMRLLQATS